MDRISLPEACRGWQQIQDSLSRLTGMEFALYNDEGKPVGMTSGESPFCRSIRRGGPDGEFCKSRCGKRIREAAGGESVVSFRCDSGQSVFLIPVNHGDSRLVISGGKTFFSRDDYKKAIRMIKAGGGRVSLTGRHRYRFIGKRRLADVVELVRNTASRYFRISHQKSAYQLRYSRQAALLESAGLLYGESALSDIAGTLLRCVVTLFDADTASLIFYGEEESIPQAHYVAGERAEAVRKAGEELEKGVLAVLGESRGEYVPIRQTGKVAALGLPGGMTPVLVIPLRRSRHALGALCLYGADLGVEDLPALRTYVAQCAAVMENQRLRGRLEDKIEKLRTLVSIGARMNELKDKGELVNFIFEQSAELLQAERGSLMLLNHKTDELIVEVSRGLSEEMGRKLRIKPGQGIAGKVAKDGAPLVVDDLEKALSISKRPDYRTKSFISLPLKSEGRVIGVINLSDKFSGNIFSQEDLELITGLISQASAALEKVRLALSLEELRRSLEGGKT